MSKLFHLFEVLEKISLLKEFIYLYIPSKLCMLNFSSAFDQFQCSLGSIILKCMYSLHFTLSSNDSPFFTAFGSKHLKWVFYTQWLKSFSPYSHYNIFLSDFISILDRPCSFQVHQVSEIAKSNKHFSIFVLAS